MRLILVAIFAFGFLVWDMGRNNGHCVREINASIDDVLREVRWHQSASRVATRERGRGYRSI